MSNKEKVRDLEIAPTEEAWLEKIPPRTQGHSILRIIGLRNAAKSSEMLRNAANISAGCFKT